MNIHQSFHEAQSLIDEEITDLRARLSLLQNRRNGLAPVSKLPDEILVRIFLIFRDSTDLHPKKWQHITHICQYWRHVAVRSPSLWTQLHDFPPALAQLMLERSQNAPLHVRLTFRHSVTTLTAILHEIERIRTLNVDLGPSNFLDTIYDILAGLGRDWGVPALESLIIHLGRSLEPHPAFVRVVTDIFRPTRRLRRLSLINAPYDGGMFPLPSLTHLCLYGRSLDDVSGAQFVETLHHMQNLQALEISLEDTNIRQFPPTLRLRPIHFPRLRRLEITDGDEGYLEPFLPLVTHPQLHQLRVNPSYMVTNIVAFTKLILSPIGTANFGPLEFMRIQDQDVTLSTSPEADIHPPDESSSFINTWIPTDAHSDCGTPFEFIADIMSCLTPPDWPDRIRLRHICLDSSDAAIGDFTQLFGSLPHLGTIEIYDRFAPVLFKAMNVTSDVAVPTTPIPFPKLHTIIWHGHDHRQHDCDYIETGAPLLSSAIFSDLYSGLLSRRVHGVPITKLELGIHEQLEDIQDRQLKEIGLEVVIR
ncbi:hypothetical protein D9619_010019 [Psilocybe cf. subviscida]|uniref:F-box domain-containing protein n=1 Tax=Psilocybe cf. subviscida TaxID=2480587 RepID=A0A8H5BKL2_9AGAR|nr:hypothetical protein D9619_010019 [Psilocybe cf. subviscida]